MQNKHEISDEIKTYLELNGIKKDSREYKQSFSNMIKSDFYERYFEHLSNNGTISNGDISDFCSEYFEFGFSENYMRAILVPAILQDFGQCIE